MSASGKRKAIEKKDFEVESELKSELDRQRQCKGNPHCGDIFDNDLRRGKKRRKSG